MLIVHLFVGCARVNLCHCFFFPPGIRDWLRLLLVALPGLFCLPFLYTKQVIFLYTKIWVGFKIVKSSTIFPVFNGLLTAQVFRKHAYNITTNNTFMPGLYIRKRAMILTLVKTKQHETDLVLAE